MIRQLSPGIVTNEIDIYYTQTDSTRQTNAAIVGDFNWGDVDNPIYVTNINQVIKKFTFSDDMAPISSKNATFLSAYNYLNYNSGGLWVTRALPSNGYNAIMHTNDPNYSNPGNINFDTQFRANTVTAIPSSDIEINSSPENLTLLNNSVSGNTLYVLKEYERNKLLYSDDIKLGLDEKYFEQNDQDFISHISSERNNKEYDEITTHANYTIESSSPVELADTTFTPIKLYNTPNSAKKYTFASTTTNKYFKYVGGKFISATETEYNAKTLTKTSILSIKTNNIHESTFDNAVEISNSIIQHITDFRSKITELKNIVNTLSFPTKVARFDLEYLRDSADIYIKISNIITFASFDIKRSATYSFARKSFAGGIFDSTEGFEYNDVDQLIDTPTNSSEQITFSGYFKAETSSKIVVLKMSNVDSTGKELYSYSVGFDLNLTSGGYKGRSTEEASYTYANSIASLGGIQWHKLSITAKLRSVSDINLDGNNKFEIFYIDTPANWTTFPSLTSTPTSESSIEFGALQVEQNSAVTDFQPKPLAERLQYVGMLSSVDTTTSTIKLTTNIDVPIHKNDKIIIRNLSEYSKITIKSHDDFADYSGNEYIIAKYPGKYGNSLKVIICSNKTEFNRLDQSYKKLFNNIPPGTNYTYFSKTKKEMDDEIYIIVIDNGGKFTNKPNSVLEYWKLSKAINATNEFNENIYYKDVINKKSNYILINRHLDEKTWGRAYESISKFISLPNKEHEFKLGGGDAPTPSDIINSWRLLNDTKKYPLDIIISSGSDIFSSADDNMYVIRNILDITEDRKDCVMVISPHNFISSRNPLNDIMEYFNALGVDSNKIIAVDNWKSQINPYTKTDVWVPLSADIAGLIARTDRDHKPWYSPAGYTRGKINNAKTLAWNPSKDDRDILYPAGINSVIFENGTGVLLFGDKTHTTKPTLLGKINIRRLFFALEKTISNIAVQNLFEFNDEYTRNTCKNSINSYLSTVKSDRGIDEFLVICDETNNTADVINNSGFVVDVFIRPTNSINFIQLNFINTPYGVDFNITE